MKNTVVYIFIVLVVLAGGLYFFSKDSLNTANSISITGTIPKSANTNQKVETNPIESLVLKDLEGSDISFAEYKGNKSLVLDFWASWCHNCRRDMPLMESYYKKYKDDVEVIAINLQESNSTAKRFVDSQGFTFKIAMDPTSQASRAFGVRFTNTHVLINKEGEVVKVIPGDIKESDFISLIEN